MSRVILYTIFTRFCLTIGLNLILYAKRDFTKIMASTFVCYIDEAGCDGFKFNKGSSQWLVLAGIITERKNDLAVTSLINLIRAKFGMPPKKPIHWRDLKHNQKKYYCNEIARNEITVTTVCVDKTRIQKKEEFKEQNRLYFYYTRYLLERLSWFARESYGLDSEGNGKIDLIFSHRGTMSYTELWTYFKLLRQMKLWGEKVEICWNNIGNFEVSTPGRKRGLQIADAAAGAFWNGLERDNLGLTEPSYALILKPIVYNRQGNYFSYGFKIIPGFQAYTGDPLREWIFSFK